MNLNNYNATSAVPTELISEDVMPFGEEVGAIYGQLKWERQTDEIFGEVYVANI